MRAAPVDEEMSLGELLEDGLFIDGDWIESKDQDPDGAVRLIQLADVGDAYFRDRSSRFLTLEKAKDLRCTFLQPGDILVARMPEPLGRACLFPGVGQPAVTAVDVCILRPNPKRARAEWLVKAINSPAFRDSMQDFVRGTTRQRISRKNLAALRLSVPDVDEQLTTASFIDEIAKARSSAAAHLASTRRAIERFRQAILAAACVGRLTADWREKNPANDHAEGLVAEIDKVRRTRPGRRYKPTESFVVADVPPGWVWTTLGALVDVATGATPLRKRTDYYGGSVPWVTSGAVNAHLITEPTELITDLALRETNAKVFPAGTLLVAMYGEGQTRGRVAELGIEAATNQAVAALLFDRHSEPLKPYLRVFLLENYERVRQLSFGGVQPNLSLGVVRDTRLMLPPIAEQAEIIRRVGQLLAVADRLTSRIDAASRRIDRSTQAVLGKAFRGELIGAAASGGNPIN